MASVGSNCDEVRARVSPVIHSLMINGRPGQRGKNAVLCPIAGWISPASPANWHRQVSLASVFARRSKSAQRFMRSANGSASVSLIVNLLPTEQICVDEIHHGRRLGSRAASNRAPNGSFDWR